MIRATLLTAVDCHLCEHARQVLERRGGDYELHVDSLDIGSVEGHRRAVEAGVVFPPALLLDDGPTFHGRLSEKRLRRELDGLSSPDAV